MNKRSRKIRKNVGAAAVQSKRLRPKDGCRVERAIEVRKERAAAGALVPQRRSEAHVIYRDQNEVGLSRKVTPRRFGDLTRGGKMDEPVAAIDSGSQIAAVCR